MVRSGHPGLGSSRGCTPSPVLVAPVAALYCCTSNPQPADFGGGACVITRCRSVVVVELRVCRNGHTFYFSSICIAWRPQAGSKRWLSQTVRRPSDACPAAAVWHGPG